MIEQFLNDPQIQSNLFKLFEKMTQIITNFDSKYLDNSKINGSPKDISKHFKVFFH